MKGNRDIREGVTKADELEMLAWISSRRKCRCNDEAEPAIVAMIADKDTPLGALLANGLKPRPDELAAHPAPLKRRLDRHRPEGEPPALHRGTHLRERNVTNDLLTKHGDERHGKRIGFAQRIDDERLPSVAEPEPGEGTRRERPDRVPISDRLVTDDNEKTVSITQGRLQ